nr:MAG TPA: hypothetical protein [Caudoviricetes sp.]
MPPETRSRTKCPTSKMVSREQFKIIKEMISNENLISIHLNNI